MKPSHEIGQHQVSLRDRALADLCSQFLDRVRSEVGSWEILSNKLTYSDELGRIEVDLQPEAAGSVIISVSEESVGGEHLAYSKRFANLGQVLLGHPQHALCELANAAIEELGMRDAAVEIATRCAASMRRLAELPEIVRSGRIDCTISSCKGGLELIDADNFRCTVINLRHGTGSRIVQWHAEIESYHQRGPQVPAVQGAGRNIVERLFVYKPSAEGRIVDEMAETLLKLYISHAC